MRPIVTLQQNLERNQGTIMIAKMNEPLASNNPNDATVPNTLPPGVANRMPATQASFAETALKLGGKSDEEVRRTGAMDKADEQVESLFARQHQTSSSPIHRAVWDKAVPVELFSPVPSPRLCGERARVRGSSPVPRAGSAGRATVFGIK